jgi:hypothetical protein
LIACTSVIDAAQPVGEQVVGGDDRPLGRAVARVDLPGFVVQLEHEPAHRAPARDQLEGQRRADPGDVARGAVVRVTQHEHALLGRLDGEAETGCLGACEAQRFIEREHPRARAQGAPPAHGDHRGVDLVDAPEVHAFDEVGRDG